MHITIATYNIHAGIGTDRKFDPDRIIKVLRELDADVVALQEVEHHLVGDLDLLDYLAQGSESRAIAGPTLLRETRDYGNALLTRLPIRELARIDLSIKGREARGALDVTFDCHGKSLHVVATHLGLTPGERRHQVRRLMTLFKPEPDISVLMGDLNEWFLWGRPLRWLHAHFQSKPNYPTFPSRWPLFALDHIWIEPRSCLIALRVHSTQLARRASDHLPLSAVIKI